MSASTRWDDVRTRLVDELATLDDGESLVLSEPDRAAPPAGRRWFGLGPRSGPAATAGRYVQASRLGADLLCESVSAAYADLTPEQTTALQTQGWSDPEQQPGGVASENHVYLGRVEDPAGSADMLVGALRVLGTGVPDARWRWDRVA
ncbi:TY-Chap domain-containing protein [uncultured Serinicoccus sp.]|uniref:TY-Chap domain-containing protein n=1 Tax=uncultured Serinicoccus sp. TaxID=735514 RepID=UPI002620442C|nr:hypothetical protein [uncultured Serinicoccus sp.]